MTPARVAPAPTPDDRALIADPGVQRFRARLEGMLLPYRVMIDAARVPSYVRLSLTDLLDALDRWKADESQHG